MAAKEGYKIFVGGLSWDIDERQLENAFNRYGRVLETQIMLERDTGRPRGFGFITFADRRGMDDAIREMHGRELGERTISVNKAEPRMGEGMDHGNRGVYRSGGRESYRGGDKSGGQDDCFKCGRPGHWARDCPSGGGRGGSFSSRPRFGGDGDRGDRFGDRPRYIEDRYEGGRMGVRENFESRDNKYGSRDRFVNDRYQSGGDRFDGSSYGGGERFLPNGYGKDRGYDREGYPRGGNDRYGNGGPFREEGKSFRHRPGPYDRPSRGGRPSSLERLLPDGSRGTVSTGGNLSSFSDEQMAITGSSYR